MWNKTYNRQIKSRRECILFFDTKCKHENSSVKSQIYVTNFARVFIYFTNNWQGFRWIMHLPHSHAINPLMAILLLDFWKNSFAQPWNESWILLKKQKESRFHHSSGIIYFITMLWKVVMLHRSIFQWLNTIRIEKTQ